jgi:hypothetical protein
MLQSLIVTLIVAVAFGYSSWSFLPRPVKRRLAARLSSRAAQLGIEAETAHALERRLAASGGCSDCSSCGQCAPAARPANVAVVAMPTSRRYTQP